MQPNQPSQYQNNPNTGPTSQPSGSRSSSAWDFLSQPEPPKKESFFARYKKLIIVAGAAFGILILLAVVASLSSSSGSNSAETNITETSSEVPAATVAMSTYDGEYFSLQYPSSLAININESLGEPEGWFLHFADNPELFTYDIAVQAGKEVPAYDNGSEAITAFLADTEIEPSNVTTSAVVLAGADTIKTTGEYTNVEGEERYVVYASVKIGETYVIVNGTYPKNNQDIVGNFDAMIGSISLKQGS